MISELLGIDFTIKIEQISKIKSDRNDLGVGWLQGGRDRLGSNQRSPDYE